MDGPSCPFDSAHSASFSASERAVGSDKEPGARRQEPQISLAYAQNWLFAIWPLSGRARPSFQLFPSRCDDQHDQHAPPLSGSTLSQTCNAKIPPLKQSQVSSVLAGRGGTVCEARRCGKECWQPTISSAACVTSCYLKFRSLPAGTLAPNRIIGFLAWRPFYPPTKLNVAPNCSEWRRFGGAAEAGEGAEENELNFLYDSPLTTQLPSGPSGSPRDGRAEIW